MTEVELDLSTVDLLIVNETETRMLLGLPECPPEEYSSKIYSKYGCNVVTTLGSKGSVIYSPGLQTHVNAVPVDVLDTTGAGDAFVGGLAHSIANEKELLEAVLIANQLASEVCGFSGAQGYLVDPDQIYKKALK